MRFGPPKPSFINTYSLSFDGVDDRLALSSDFVASGEFTISFWMKPSTIAGNGDKYLIGQWPTNFDNAILIDQLSRIRIAIGGVAFTFSEDFYGSNYIVLNTWQNITITRDSSNGVRCFRNGLDFGYSGTPVTNANILTLNSIGRLYSNTYGFSGEFDEIAFLNTDETSNVSTLATAPTVDLSSLNPTVWLRMGDNGAYKDPQWLIPNNKNKDKVSNYSMDFDGVDDYINCGDLTSLVDNKSKLSISYWVNFPNVTEVNRTTGKCSDPATTTKWIDCSGYLGEILFVVAGTGLNESLAYALTGAVLTNNTWHHVVCVFDGTQVVNTDRVKIYVDNVDEALTYNQLFPSTTYDFTLEPTNPPWYIGQTGLQLGNNELRGMLDEYAIYSDVALTATMVDEIFNEGTPKDLTTLPTTSSPDLWYKMGENATYTTVWNIPDEIGSNDVTTIAMTIEDRVGTAPSSSNNSLSFNMDLIDRVEDTP